MTNLKKAKTLSIAVFGSLRAYMDGQDLPYTLEREVPEEGCSARDVAAGLDLPPDKIEAVFRNGQVINIYDPVFQGDRLAFFPQGTPGPYRVFLGMVRENLKRSKREKTG